MTEDWRKSIDNKEAVAAVVVDWSKAFDAVNHNLLLAKLKAYLLGPQQCVRLDGVCFFMILKGFLMITQ